MEFSDVVRQRRMVRDFSAAPVAPSVVDTLLRAATHTPSAGYTQGTSFVVLEGPEQTGGYWDATLPAERRAGFPWPGLLRAPVIVVVIVDPGAYVARYAEPDKARTGLGASAEAWTVPYWWVDGGMAAQAMLYAAVDAGLGALFFGVFEHEPELLRALGVPHTHRAVGTIAIGHPNNPESRPSEPGADPAPSARPMAQGSAATRRRRSPAELIHRARW